MRISDWSSDGCSSDLASADAVAITDRAGRLVCANDRYEALFGGLPTPPGLPVGDSDVSLLAAAGRAAWRDGRSEEHTSELQSLMRSSYAVFCLKKKKNHHKL